MGAGSIHVLMPSPQNEWILIQVDSHRESIVLIPSSLYGWMVEASLNKNE